MSDKNHKRYIKYDSILILRNDMVVVIEYIINIVINTIYSVFKILFIIYS